jgi:small-conductance mechanosensitive channel
MLWRILPHGAVALLAVFAALVLGASESVRHQVLVGSLHLLAYALLRALATEILSPLRPQLRVLPLGDRAALQVLAGVRVLLAILLVTELGAWLVRENGWVPSVASLLVMLRKAALLVFAAVALVASGVARRVRSRLGEGTLGFLFGFVVRVLVPLGVVAALFDIGARGLGYVPLASWVRERALLTSAQLLLLALAYRVARGAVRRAVILGGAKVEGATHQPSPAAIGAERIAAGSVRLLAVLLGTLWVLSTWGIGAAVIAANLQRPVLPGGTLVWGTFVGGLGRIALVLVLGRLLKTALTFFVFPRARVDVGARYAILAMLRYVVVVAVVFFSLSTLGVETSSLAWVLGAAGVGLGLGLQDVLGNFFGGLVMLVERPVRVGDFVVVGDAAGTVEAIRIRGTLIRTPDNTTVLVPNRQMLSERVTNLSYGLQHRRLQVAVGVAYGTDPGRVREILLDLARRHPLVAATPAPFVQLQGFGPSSLDFVLFAHPRAVTEPTPDHERRGARGDLSSSASPMRSPSGPRM